ncbi:MAG: response regulator [Nitrospirae bacterium]|nr:response regulator [Nitrospirota bacterium]
MEAGNISEKKYRILVVEDDRGINGLIRKALESSGFHTVGSLDGRDAASKLNTDTFSMMILDYQLSDMKGSELVESLREDRKVPFIIVTGHGDEKIAVEMMKLGARDYIIKDKGFLDMLPLVAAKAVNDIERERRLNEIEKKVMHAAEEWSCTFDSIADFVTVNDSDFRITKANKALADFLGVSKDDLIGKFCYEVMHDAKEPPPGCPHTKALKGGKTVTFDIFEEKFGRYFNFSVSPINDSHNQARGVVHYIKDITMLKQSEEELKKRVEDLERFYNMAVNRELKMKELKSEIERLNEELSKYRQKSE